MIGRCPVPISLTANTHFSAFIEPDLFDNNVLFDNTTSIYESALEIRVKIWVRLRVVLF